MNDKHKQLRKNVQHAQEMQAWWRKAFDDAEDDDAAALALRQYMYWCDVELDLLKGCES